MKRVQFITVVIIGLFISTISLGATYGGGSGTASAPYQIWTPAQMNTIGANPADWSKCFILMADIDMSAYTDTQYNIIGNDTIRFNGNFDGNGHVIRNIKIKKFAWNIGLFGWIDTDGQILNLGIETAMITGLQYVGMLVGFNCGTVSNCYAIGEVSGQGHGLGGLIGYQYSGTVNNCYTAGTVTGGSFAGGLTGLNFGTINNCYSTSTVFGVSYLGGLSGTNYGTVNSCYASGTVTGPFSNSQCIGGLSGLNGGSVNQCYSRGPVTGNSSIGGLIGENNRGAVNQCYSTSEVSGLSDKIGGLIGYDYYGGYVKSCFWDINTSGQSGSSAGKGLTSSQMKSIIVYQNAGWSDKGWIINDGLDYPHLLWETTIGVSIPSHQAIPLWGSGTETDPYQIWTAADFALLSWHISVLDKHITLMADLDMTGVSIYPLGDLAPFTGIFEGNNHIIYNVSIDSPVNNYVGLFAYAGPDSQIRNLGFKSFVIKGFYYVGGLIGLNCGQVTHCYTTGSVFGTYHCVGGLIGYNAGGIINDCYATGSVTGGNYYLNVTGGLIGYNVAGAVSNCYASGNVVGSSDYVGGLIGENQNSTVNNSYATGAVTGGSDYTGGLCGYNEGSQINNCYATGAVYGYSRYVGGLIGRNSKSDIRNCFAGGEITDGASFSQYTGGLIGDNSSGGIIACFWDKQASKQTTGVGYRNTNGVTGKTTAEMQTLSTFISAGWDFVGETANGTADIWFIRQGLEYPRFVWENQQSMANAGADTTAYLGFEGKTVNVTLDGGGSSDADGDALTYKWYEGETLLSEEISPTVSLSAGEHTITLIVNDGIEDSPADEVIVHIVGPVWANMRITPSIFSINGSERFVWAILDLPDGITLIQLDRDFGYFMLPGNVSPMQFWHINGARPQVIARFEREQLRPYLDAGRMRLTFYGRLNDGRYIGGSYRVWVIILPEK